MSMIKVYRHRRSAHRAAKRELGGRPFLVDYIDKDTAKQLTIEICEPGEEQAPGWCWSVMNFEDAPWA